jgi:hypothetical protein
MNYLPKYEQNLALKKQNAVKSDIKTKTPLAQSAPKILRLPGSIQKPDCLF